MVKRQWNKNLFNIQWRKNCCCGKIYWDFKKQDLQTYDSCVKKMFILMFWMIFLIDTITHIIRPSKWNLYVLNLILFQCWFKDPKFQAGDHVRVWKYKNIFAKGYAPNWWEEVFAIRKIKNTIPWTYVICDLNGEGIVGTCYEKELQKTNQKEFRIEKLLKKENKLYVK